MPESELLIFFFVFIDLPGFSSEDRVPLQMGAKRGLSTNRRPAGGNAAFISTMDQEPIKIFTMNILGKSPGHEGKGELPLIICCF